MDPQVGERIGDREREAFPATPLVDQQRLHQPLEHPGLGPGACDPVHDVRIVQRDRGHVDVIGQRVHQGLRRVTQRRTQRRPAGCRVAVQGGCFTGGLELALAGDIILAGESASFADTHGKFALVPVWGMSQRLPRRVGQWKAREISFTGLPVSGVEAARIGLANACVPDAELEARTLEMAEAIAAQSRHSVFAYKRLYTAQADLPLEAGLAYEIVNSAGVGPDMAERVSGRFG